jgi:hypothetical protein
MSKQELSEAAQKLLQLIPTDGSYVGNTSLSRKSGLGEEYWNVRKELDQAGLITFGRGRGGSIALQLSAAAPVSVIEAAPSKNLVGDEADLYEPFRKLLNDDWGAAAKESEDFFELRITASPRKWQRDSGQWSRPDLTLVEVTNFEYLPGSNLEVTTFEVKRYADVLNLASVYEAAAHSRWAHYAYLVAEAPEEGVKFTDRFLSELQRFRVGLMTLWREKGEWKFNVEGEPERLSPDPKELDSLLKTFFSDAKRAKEFRSRVGSK